MAGYIATRCKEKKDNDGLNVAQEYYKAIFSKSIYLQFKEDVDLILVTDGYDDVIIEV